jgi:pimeloyl-ACP methyl ester carboxylesterase
MAYADLPAIRLHYEISGQGPPMVLIPGWTLNTRLWDLMVPRLEPRFTVLRYDVRGAGLSTSDPELEYSRVADAEDLAALLDGVGLEKAHLVGHSKGARIAFTFAMTRPSRVLSVTGLGSAEPHPSHQEVPNFRPIAAAWVERARTMARDQGSTAVVEYLSGARLFGKLRTSPEGLKVLRLAMKGYAASDLLSRAPKRELDTRQGAAALTMPVFYLAGEEDPFLPECQYAHTLVPHSRFEVIPKCGHMAPLERPDAVAEALLDFFQRQKKNHRGTETQRKKY